MVTGFERKPNVNSGLQSANHLSGSGRRTEPLQGGTMKSSTKDQATGKLHELKGKVKEKVGHATNDPNMEAEGQDEKVAGKIQKKVGQIEKVFEK
jgi:uncharacterized protein YjbJ (UPF0337 family)